MRKILILSLALLFTIGVGTVVLSDVMDKNVFDYSNPNKPFNVDISQHGGESATFINDINSRYLTLDVDQVAEKDALLINKIRAFSGLSVSVNQLVKTSYGNFENSVYMSALDTRLDNVVAEFLADAQYEWQGGVKVYVTPATRKTIFGQRLYMEDTDTQGSGTMQRFYDISGSGWKYDYLKQEVGVDRDPSITTKDDLDDSIDMWDTSGGGWDWQSFLETGDTDYFPAWTQQGYLNKNNQGAGYGGKASLAQEGRIIGDIGFVSHSGHITNIGYSGSSEITFNTGDSGSGWLDFDQGLFYSE